MANHKKAVRIAAEALFEAGVYGEADACVFIPEKQYNALQAALNGDEKWGNRLVVDILRDVNESDEEDPEDVSTVTIGIDTLQMILERHIMGAE